jgi:hypothetical protein
MPVNVSTLGCVMPMVDGQEGRHRTQTGWVAFAGWSGGEKMPVDVLALGCVMTVVDGQIMRHLPQGR